MNTITNEDPSKRLDYRFTADWTTHNLAGWKKWMKPATDPVNIIEIGAWEGRSTVWFMDNLLENPESRLTVIDPWVGSDDRFKDYFTRNIGLHPRREQVTVVRDKSRRHLGGLPDEEYDLVYVDGEHEGLHVMLDGLLSLHKLKLGGRMIFDDYSWLDPTNRCHTLPRYAIDSFCAIARQWTKLVGKSYQLCVEKTAHCS